jgi:hypothetical protein
MKDYIIHFSNHHKGSNGRDICEAARYKRTGDLYIFYDDDGNTIAQYEVRNVVGVRELPPQKEGDSND